MSCFPLSRSRTGGYAPAGSRLDRLRDQACAVASAQDATQVARLIDAGAIPRNCREEVLAFVAALDGSAEFSFAEGGRAKTQTDWFFRFMREQPAGLFDPDRDYRPHEVFGRPSDTAESFASGEAARAAADGVSLPRGYAVTPGSEQLLRQVRQIERDQGVSFAAALDVAMSEAAAK